jgi:hypothetical protein
MEGQRTFETARKCDLKIDRSGSHNSWCRSIWTAVILFKVPMGHFSNNVNPWKNCEFLFNEDEYRKQGTQLSLALSSNHGGRKIPSPEQVLSDTVKIRNCYVLGVEIKIK